MQFTETQVQTLQAVTNRLIPPDDYPGAWDNGVGDYISRLLDTDAQPLQTLYMHGLDAIEAEAQARFERGFTEIAAEQQDALLHDLEKGTVETAWPISPREWLSVLVNHTAEGYYADPGNGGNRDCISWKMLGWGDERDR